MKGRLSKRRARELVEPVRPQLVELLKQVVPDRLQGVDPVADADFADPVLDAELDDLRRVLDDEHERLVEAFEDGNRVLDDLYGPSVSDTEPREKHAD